MGGCAHGMSEDDLDLVYERINYYSYWPLTGISLLIAVVGLLYVFCLHHKSTKAGFVKVIWALISLLSIFEIIRLAVSIK